MNFKIKKIFSILLILTVLFSMLSLSNVSAASSEKVIKNDKNIDGNSIAELAKTYIGYPYVFGMAGPRAFDCSGFVKFIFAQFGVSLPHNAGAFFNTPTAYGTVVDSKNAMPGDICSWKGHVGIYIGDGKVVNALCPRYGVCITNIATFRNRFGVTNPPHHFLRISIKPKEDQNKKSYNALSNKFGKNFYAFIKNGDSYLSGEKEKVCSLGDERTLWKFERQKDGSFKISLAGKKRFLSLKNMPLTASTNVCVRSKKNAQSFFIKEKNGKFIFETNPDSSTSALGIEKEFNSLVLGKETAFKIEHRIQKEQTSFFSNFKLFENI